HPLTQVWHRESFRRRRCLKLSAAPAETPLRPASAPASEKTSAFHVPQSPSFDSWLHPRSGRHRKSVGFDEFVPQLPSGVMDEHVIQSCVLYGKRLHPNARVHSRFH